MPSVPVKDAAMIGRGSDMMPNIRRLDNFERFISQFLSAEFNLAAHFLKMCRLVGRLEMPRLQVAGDTVLFDAIMDGITRRQRHPHYGPRPLNPEGCGKITHRPSQARDQMSAVAAGRSKTDPLGFQQYDRHPRLRRAKRR